MPVPAALNVAGGDPQLDLKAAQLLRPRLLGVDNGEALGWLERRLETVQAEQRSDLSHRWGSFEQGDRRFKEWVQREHEQLHSLLQQAKAAAVDGQQQQQQEATALQGHCQQLQSRLQELEAAVAHAAAQGQALAQFPGGPGALEGALTSLQAGLEALRAELAQEAAARVSLGSETTERVKELHGLVAQVNNRHEQEALAHQQQLAGLASELHSHSLQHDLEALRTELDTQRRSSSELLRRCAETETTCAQRLAGVQESALAAARELWEEHQGVVTECKTSMASLKQILEAKDKIAAQLQSIQQQQREDDKQELLAQLQQGHEVLRSRVAGVEAAVSGEHGASSESRQHAEAQVGRLGAALERAQAGWLKDSQQFATELRELRRQVAQKPQGDERSWERRLAEAVDGMQKRLDELEGQASVAKTGLGLAQDRLAEVGQEHQAEVKEAEVRLKQLMDDLKVLQASQLSQCDFDIRSHLRIALDEHAGRVQTEMRALRAAADTASREAELKLEQLMKDVTGRATALEERLSQDLSAAETKAGVRLTEELRVERERTHDEVSRAVEEERSARLQAEAERLASLQKRLAVFEELLQGRLSEAMAAQEDARAAEREALEARLLKDRKGMQRHLEEAAQTAASDAATALTAELAQSRKELEEALQVEVAGLNTKLAEAGVAQSAELEALQAEVAGFGARVAEAGAAQSAELRSGLATAEDARRALRAELDAQAARLGEAEATGEAARAELRAAVDASVAELSSRLGEQAQQLTAIEATANASVETARAEAQAAVRQAEAAVEEARSVAKADVTKVSDRLSEFSEKVGTMEDNFTAGLKELSDLQAEAKTAVEELRLVAKADTTKVSDRLTEFAEKVASMEDDLIARVKELFDKQTEAQQQDDMMVGNFQRQLGELGVQVEASRRACNEAITDVRQAGDAAVKSMQERLVADLNGVEEQRLELQKLVEAVEAKLTAELHSTGDWRSELQKRVEDLHGDLRKEEEHARVQEAAIRQALDEQKQLQVGEAMEAASSLQRQSEDAIAELRTKVDDMRYEHESALTREERQHEAAVKRLGGQLEALRDSVDEEHVRLRELDVALGTRLDELHTEQRKGSEALHGAERSLGEETARAQAAESKLHEQLQTLQEAQEEAVSAREGEGHIAQAELRQQLEDRSGSDRAAVQAAVDEQLKQLKEQQKQEVDSTVSELRSQLDVLKAAQEQALQAAEAELLRKLTAQEGEKLAELRQQQEQMQAELHGRQEEVSGDVVSLGKRVEELAQLREAGADLAKLQQRVDTMATEQGEFRKGVDETSKNLEARSSGLEERMGSLVQTTEDLTGKVEGLASAEAVKQLSARVDGGFSALVVRMESERWLRDNVDKVADNVTNNFLRLLDESSQKLAARVDRCEQRLGQRG